MTVSTHLELVIGEAVLLKLKSLAWLGYGYGRGHFVTIGSWLFHHGSLCECFPQGNVGGSAK